MLGLSCCSGFCLVVASGSYSLGAVHRLLFIVTSFVVKHMGPRHASFSSCGSQVLEHRLDRCSSWHVASSQIRDQTAVSCIDRWILYQWAQGDAPNDFLLFLVSDSYFCFFMGHVHDFKFINLKFMSSSIHFSQCLNSIHLPLPSIPTWLSVRQEGLSVPAVSRLSIVIVLSEYASVMPVSWILFFLLLLMVSLSLSSLVSWEVSSILFSNLWVKLSNLAITFYSLWLSLFHSILFLFYESIFSDLYLSFFSF